MFELPKLSPDEILIYLRKSRTDDPALTVSDVVARHEQLLDAFSLERFGDLVPERNRFREIVSGETIAARPEVQKVLRLIEQPQYKAVLIIEPQRLSRGDLEDIGYLSKVFRYTNTVIITLQYSYDLADDRDREFFENELKRGNEFLEYSKRIMRNGVRASVERGNYIATFAPYGYKLLKIKDGKRYTHTLEIVPHEADIVRMIFRMYSDGNGANRIATTLNRMNIKPPRTSFWKADSIYAILDNYHYIGKIKWSTRKKTISVVDGEIKKSRPRCKPEIFDGKHPAIIDADLWDAVRQRREEKSIPKVRSSFDIQNPLAHLLYCECGCSMRQTVPAKRSRRAYCPNQPICKNAGCTTDIIIQMIADSIRQEIADVHVTLSDGKELAESTAQIKVLQSKVDALTAKQDALWEKYAEGMPRDTFERLLAKNDADIAECTRMLSDALNDADSIEHLQTAEASLYAALDAIESNNAPAKETNEFLRAIIKRITYSRKRAEKSAGGNRGGWKTYEPEIRIEYWF